MRILLGPRSSHLWGRAILPGMVVLCVLLAAGQMPAPGQTSNSGLSSARNSDRLPLTTSSPEAARLFEEGLLFSYNDHIEQALAKWREATRQDPNFAQAWVYILWWTPDPAEAKQSAEKAQIASQGVTPGEKLLVKWRISAYNGRFVDAIAAMNDLLAMYPRDASLNAGAALWLLFPQSEYEVSARFAKRALEVDPDFAAVFNIMGYDLAAMHRYDEAISYLKRYAAAEPNDSNPRDSLAEIQQKAGQLEASLAEYREALKLNPENYYSQLGVGNDYALLGKQDRAREEYARALPMMESSPQYRLRCQIQSAITYAREGNVTEAQTRLAAVLEEAIKLHQNNYRSVIHQDMALLAASRTAAFQQLDEAEEVLEGADPTSEADRTAQLASTLRIRARLAAEAGKLEMARAAVARLQKMVHVESSNGVERAYNGANGALLAAESKVGAAIEKLEEDPEDPFSMAKLAELQTASGHSQDAEKVRARLKADYGISLADWLVVRRFRQ